MDLLPTLTGAIPYPVELAIRMLDAGVRAVEADLREVANRAPTPLTLAEIRRALGATGSTPLNIFTLLGGDVSGIVQTGTHAQRAAINPATLAPGALFWETDRTAFYMVVANLWTYVAGTPHGGTLSPDTRPSDLGTADAGFEIRATDFDRLYRWTGTAWLDAPGQPPREIVWIPAALNAAFVPTTGYQLCDGTANVRVSLPDGTTVLITVPDLTTANRFLRAVAGATGGSGGNATSHTHPVNPPATASGAPSATVVVQSGAGTTVATSTHTHSTDIAQFDSGTPSGVGGDDGLPPYYNARPYLRL